MTLSPRIRSVSNLNAARSLRAELMGMAADVSESPDELQILSLISPRMTEARIEAEWALCQRVFRPELARRLAIRVLGKGGRARSFGEIPDATLAKLSKEKRSDRETGATLPQPAFGFIVLKLLVHSWATGKGPVTTRWLEETAGCSYPTVASALKRLGSLVVRQSDRRVGLRGFPKDEWSRVLATAGTARSTMRFADRSGQPRLAASLVERLRMQHPAKVALGGILGARHYQPEIDIMGLPRLDISVHSPGRWPDLAFVQKLDPALEATSDQREPARLVVHFVRHAASLFQDGEGSFPVADPIECLLDLHEARLESQAVEFVEAFGRSPGAGR
jgi:hypothetical protein